MRDRSLGLEAVCSGPQRWSQALPWLWQQRGGVSAVTPLALPNGVAGTRIKVLLWCGQSRRQLELCGALYLMASRCTGAAFVFKSELCSRPLAGDGSGGPCAMWCTSVIIMTKCPANGVHPGVLLPSCAKHDLACVALALGTWAAVVRYIGERAAWPVI